MASDNKLSAYTRNAIYEQVFQPHNKSRMRLQVSCSNHAVTPIIAWTANYEDAFAFVNRMQAVQGLAYGETRKFH